MASTFDDLKAMINIAENRNQEKATKKDLTQGDIEEIKELEEFLKNFRRLYKILGDK